MYPYYFLIQRKVLVGIYLAKFTNQSIKNLPTSRNTHARQVQSVIGQCSITSKILRNPGKTLLPRLRNGIPQSIDRLQLYVDGTIGKCIVFREIKEDTWCDTGWKKFL
jgi:hypothetical protein